MATDRGARGHYTGPVNSSGLHDRLNAAVGDRTYRHVGELTQTHPETVRRYMQGQSPSVEFVAALSTALGLSGDWILTGRGPMKQQDARSHHLQQSSAGDLLGAMAGNVEKLMERVDRLEQYTQILETRLRGLAQDGGGARSSELRDGRPLSELRASDNHDQSAALVHNTSRAQFLADALAKRPPSDAR